MDTGASLRNILTAVCWMELMRATTFAGGQSPQMEDARRCLAKARQSAESVVAKGFDESYYRTVLLRDIALASARAGDVQGATQLSEKLLEQPTYGLPWKLDCDIEVARAMAGAGDLASASEKLERAADASMGLPKPGPRADSLVRIASAQHRLGRKEDAVRTLRRALEAADQLPLILPANTREAGLNRALALDPIAIAQREAGDIAEAEATGRAVIAAAAAIEDEIEKAGTVSMMAVERAKSGDIPGALLLLDGWHDVFGSRADPSLALALAEIAALQDARGDREGATQSVERIPAPMEQVGAYLAIARARSLAKDRPAAGARLRSALASARRIENPLTKGLILGRIGEAFAEASDRDSARATAREALEVVKGATSSSTISAIGRIISGKTTNGSQPGEALALVAIARGEARAGDEAAATDLLARAQKLAEAAERGTVRTSALGEICLARVAIQGPGAALALYQQIDPADNDVKSRTGGAIALAQAKSGDLAGAMKTIESCAAGAKKSQLIAEQAEAIAAELAESSSTDQALKWADLQREPMSKARAYLGASLGVLGKKSANPVAPPNP